MRTTSVSNEIAPARPSSTVVLVRPATPAPEIFMVKRSERASFGSAYAFPGGVLDDSDKLVHSHCAGVSVDYADRLLDVEDGGLDYFSAAIRELFEETGVLLGTTRLSNEQLEQAREQLNDGSLSWDRFVPANEIRLHCDALNYFGFWITPEDLPKRYATRFFLSELPAGQLAIHDGGELTNSCWLPAREILQASCEETMRVHYPTRKTLESMTRLKSTSALREWAKSCAAGGVKGIELAAVPRSEQ